MLLGVRVRCLVIVYRVSAERAAVRRVLLAHVLNKVQLVAAMLLVVVVGVVGVLPWASHAEHAS